MNKIIILILILYTHNLTKFDTSYTLIAIRASTKKSRFGDCLSIIYISNYLSNKFKIPIIYQKFKHSEDLEIQDVIENYKSFNNKHELKKFKIIKLENENEIDLNHKEDVIYDIFIDFFDKNHSKVNPSQIKTKFKSLISPKSQISMPCILDKNNINIAAHVRKGGGYDLPLLSQDDSIHLSPINNFKPIDATELATKYSNTKFFYSDQRWPYKFPPDSFYIEQIKKIAQIFSNKKLHVHIFTDDINPVSIVQKYEQHLKEFNILFTCRKHDNHHSKNIVDDFFAMTKFDCLVRPISSYSQNTEIIGDFKIIIFPIHGKWIQKDKLIIDKVNMITNKSEQLNINQIIDI